MEWTLRNSFGAEKIHENLQIKYQAFKIVL